VQTLGAAQFMLYIIMRTDGELYIATKYWHRVQHVSDCCTLTDCKTLLRMRAEG